MLYLKIIELVVLTLLPVFLWLQFFRDKDHHREPNYILRRIFIFGFLFTPLIGLLQWCANENIKTALGFLPSSTINCALINQSFLFLNPTAVMVITFFIAAMIEELFKFFSMRLSLFGDAKKEFDEPVDAMVYLITAALGFSAAENLLYALSLASQTGFLYDSSFINYQSDIILLIFMRSLATTLLHILSSGIFGYFFAKAYFHLKNTRLFFLKSVMIGLGFATLIHLSFNLIIQLTFFSNQGLDVIIKITGLSLLLFFSYIIVNNEFKKLQTQIISK